MGAHDYTQTYHDYNQKSVSEEWNIQVDMDTEDSGSGPYAGNATTLGRYIVFYDHKLKSECEAYEYVLNNHNKWTEPIACSFYITSKPTARDKAQVEKAKFVYRNIQLRNLNILNTMQEAFFSRKSKLVGCLECGSRLSIEYLKKKSYIGRTTGLHISYPKLPQCPLCSASLLSKTSLTRIETLNLKEGKAQEKLKTSQTVKAGKELGWVVGGWAAC